MNRPSGPGRTTRPAQARAESHIQELLHTGVSQSRLALPSIRRMARAAGVSYQAMWRTVARLASQGVLVTAHGIGTRARGATPEAVAGAIPTPVYRWERTAQRIATDIREGILARADVLPAIKVLEQHYTVSYRTLRKALRELVGRGVVVPEHRRYRVPRRTHAHAGTVLVFVTPESLQQIARRGLWQFGLLEIVSVLESECSRRGLVFTPTHVYNNAAELNRLTRAEPPFGVIVGEPAPDMRRHFSPAPAVPVAVFDDLASFRLSDTDWFRRSQQALSFQVDNYAIGHHVGAYLRSRGHSHLVYVSPFAEREFAQLRLQGLADAFRPSAGARTVTVCEAPGPAQTLPADSALVATGSRWPAPDAPLSRLPGALLPRRLVQLFDRALQARNASVWVCANDSVAVCAMSYLEQRGIAVPATLSVIGFDNSAAAVYRRLTSYDLDLNGICLAMLDHVVQGCSNKRAQPAERIRARTGRIIERDTVATLA